MNTTSSTGTARASRVAFGTLPRWFLAVIGLSIHTAAFAQYHAITPDDQNEVITLTGHDLTIEQVIKVAAISDIMA